MNLGAEYSREAFAGFLRMLCSDFVSDVRSVTIPSAAKSVVEATHLGTSRDLDLSVFELAHAGSSEKRVAFAADGFRVMRDSACFRALVVYRSMSSAEWRLSLMTATPQIDERGAVFTQLSNPRRFSFALGPAARVHTPTTFLVQKGPITGVEDLADRFSVEVVNREFYGRIASLYTELVGGVRGQGVAQTTFPGVLQLPSGYGTAARAHEFAVRLIGRIVFCWFLREKTGDDGRPMIPPNLLSLGAATIQDDYYHAVLEPLFFEVLNRRAEGRKEQFRTPEFNDVPYLNGGLFSPAEDDYYAPAGSGLLVPDEWLVRFFEVLEQYNFTVDESTSIDVDLSIDPEMLGRIFENLLAEINPVTGESARKSTGSFYTPRPIVEYMVNEALLMYLERTTPVSTTSLRALLSDDLSDDTEHPLPPVEAGAVIEALSAITVLDPACGSGAFPIGILQKIVQTLRRVDPDAQLWIQQQVRAAPPEVRRVIEREFKHKNFDYIRKLGVIRQSIYGVDVQPIATEIARLRCFLTLIVDERVDETLPNRGIEPLPNLDFKFVSANSLVELYMPERVRDDPSLVGAAQAEFFEDEAGIRELRALRGEFFSASAGERDELKVRFLQTQKVMLQKMMATSGAAKRTHQLSAWDPFGHAGTPWFDPGWMFGIEAGFDIVIANPPYLKERDNAAAFVDVGGSPLGLRYHEGKMDLWYYFLHRAIDVAKPGGAITFITSRYWINSAGARKLIGRVKAELSLVECVDIGSLKVFDSVVGHHMVAVYAKTPTIAHVRYRRLQEDVREILSATSESALSNRLLTREEVFGEEGRITLDPDPLDYSGRPRLGGFFAVTQGVVQNPDKVSSKMALRYGLRTGAGVFVVNESELGAMHLSNEERGFVRPFYYDAAIGTYALVDRGGSERQYLLYLTKANCPEIDGFPNLMRHLLPFREIMDGRRETVKGSIKWFQLHWPRKPDYFEGEKVVMATMFARPRAAYIDSPAYFGISTNVVVSGARGLSLMQLAGVLNGRFARYWFTKHGKQRGTGLDIGVDVLRRLPLPDPGRIPQELASSVHAAVVNRVGGHRGDHKLHARIDDMVMSAYGFDPVATETIETALARAAVVDPVES